VFLSGGNYERGVHHICAAGRQSQHLELHRGGSKIVIGFGGKSQSKRPSGSGASPAFPPDAFADPFAIGHPKFRMLIDPAPCVEEDDEKWLLLI